MSKHVGPLFAQAWRAAWKRLYRTRETLKQLEAGVVAVARNPVPLDGQVKAGDRGPPMSPEFRAALDEELAARGLAHSRSGQCAAHADRVLANAARRAAAYLDLSDAAVRQVLSAELVALANGEPPHAVGIPPEQRDGALRLIRIFRALDAILPNRADAIRWVHGANTALGNSPLALLEDGRLDDVLAYLERARHS